MCSLCPPTVSCNLNGQTGFRNTVICNLLWYTIGFLLIFFKGAILPSALHNQIMNRDNHFHMTNLSITSRDDEAVDRVPLLKKAKKANEYH